MWYGGWECVMNEMKVRVGTHENLQHSRCNHSKHKPITLHGIAIGNCFENSVNKSPGVALKWNNACKAMSTDANLHRSRCNKNKNMNKSPLNWVLHWKPCQQITWHGSEIENCLQNGVNRHESQLQKWQACDKQTARVTSKRSKTIGAWYLTSRLKQSPVASKQSQTKKVHRPDILSYNTMSEHVVQTVAAI